MTKLMAGCACGRLPHPLHRGAQQGLTLPLPRLSAADRQHLRDCRLLRRRFDRDYRGFTIVRTPLRQRISGHLPFLRHLRLNGLLVSVSNAQGRSRRRRLLRRSAVPGTHASRLQPAPSWLGRDAGLTSLPSNLVDSKIKDPRHLRVTAGLKNIQCRSQDQDRRVGPRCTKCPSNPSAAVISAGSMVGCTMNSSTSNRRGVPSGESVLSWSVNAIPLYY
jgi:hypothetical protein